MNPIRCALKSHRTRAAISQRALAARVGVSRQALIAIEQGRQVPSTGLALKLARALECTVEDLFQLDEPNRLLAHGSSQCADRRVVVGRVGARWAAHALHDAAHPSDGVVHTITPEGRLSVEPLVAPEDLEQHALVAGCAPLLGLLAGRLRGASSGRATWIPAHSGRALDLLEQGLVHIAGVHLAPGADAEGHAAIVRARFPGQSIAIVHLTRWQQGLLVASGNPRGIHDVPALCRTDVRVATREPGSGAHQLLVRHLGEAELSGITGPAAQGHADVAGLVRWGVADVGVAIEATARAEGLDFVPLSEERFDLLVPKRWMAHPPVARLLELLLSAPFRTEASHLPGYDLSATGETRSVGAA